MRRGYYKLPKEKIVSSFEYEGYKYLYRKKKNRSWLIYFVCPNNHKGKVWWGNWNSHGIRCFICSNKVKTDEFIRNEIISEGYEFIKIERISNNGVSRRFIHFICPNKHRYKISWCNWKRGDRCHYCSDGMSGEKHPNSLSMKEIRNCFESEGYTLLSKKHKGSRGKYKFMCPSGHIHRITIDKWNSGVRCTYCYGRIKTIKEVKKSFDKSGYVLLTDHWENSIQQLYFVCPNGHKHNMSWSSWQSGTRCKFCFLDNNRGRNHPNWRKDSIYDLRNFREYRLLVNSYTEHNYRIYKNIVNPSEYNRGKKYVLDHVYSVADGFRNNVRPKILASVPNLRIITRKENSSKFDKSYISLYSLYWKYLNWMRNGNNDVIKVKIYVSRN